MTVGGSGAADMVMFVVKRIAGRTCEREYEDVLIDSPPKRLLLSSKPTATNRERPFPTT
jgi:hypothetical protein